MLNKIQEVLKAKSERITQLLAEVESEITALGLSFQYKVLDDKQTGRGSGIVAYWKEIRKISDEQKVSRKQARKLYAERKGQPAVAGMPVAPAVSSGHKMPANFGARVSKGQKQYWRKVRKVAESQGISMKEARNILKDQAAA